MKVLILGGTVFLGRHLVEFALTEGHEVTIFNRGRTRAAHLVDVETLIGDRDGDVSAMIRRSFDAVIDCSGYTPAQMSRSAAVLAERVAHYVFISSISVYRRFAPGMRFDETASARP